MPASMNHNASLGVPRTSGPHSGVGFNEVLPYFEERNYTISGITKDASGVAIAFATVVLFSAGGLLEQFSNSDVNGAYAFICDKTRTFFVIAVKTGSPEVRGLTLTIFPS